MRGGDELVEEGDGGGEAAVEEAVDLGAAKAGEGLLALAGDQEFGRPGDGAEIGAGFFERDGMECSG